MPMDPKLSKLWDLFVSELVDRMETGEEAEEGAFVRPKAATLAVVAKFLKDHHIDNPLDDKVGKLAQLLRDAEAELPEGDYA